MTRLVGKDAHEQHAAAARRTSRTHKNSRRLSGDRRHTHTNKQTEARDPPKFRLKSKTSEPAPFRKDRSSIFLFISCIAKLDYT